MNLTKLKTDVKAWFKFSETIAIERSMVVLGFFLAAVATMDWSPLLAIDYSTDFNPKQLYALGGLCIAKGLFTEWARRRNSNLDGDNN